MTRVRLLFSLVVAIVMAACGQVDAGRFKLIQAGMTSQQVESVAGAPHGRQVGSGGTETWRYNVTAPDGALLPYDVLFAGNPSRVAGVQLNEQDLMAQRIVAGMIVSALQAEQAQQAAAQEQQARALAAQMQQKQQQQAARQQPAAQSRAERCAKYAVFEDRMRCEGFSVPSTVKW